jgi:hypothetical protein
MDKELGQRLIEKILKLEAGIYKLQIFLWSMVIKILGNGQLSLKIKAI